MPKIKSPLAIFDLDGTLFKTERLYLEAFHRAVTDCAMEMRSDDDIISRFAFTTPEMCRILYPSEEPAAGFTLRTGPSLRTYPYLYPWPTL